MRYTYEEWLSRLSERTDLSSRLTHLTRPTEGVSLAQKIYDLVESKVIKGSGNSGFICGQYRAACFQDAPLTSICQNVYFEQKHRGAFPLTKVRYLAVGLSFGKEYI